MSWFIRIRTVSHITMDSIPLGLDCYFIPEENSIITFACLRISHLIHRHGHVEFYFIQEPSCGYPYKGGSRDRRSVRGALHQVTATYGPFLPLELKYTQLIFTHYIQKKKDVNDKQRNLDSFLKNKRIIDKSSDQRNREGKLETAPFLKNTFSLFPLLRLLDRRLFPIRSNFQFKPHKTLHFFSSFYYMMKTRTAPCIWDSGIQGCCREEPHFE